ncbi:fatty acid CoA ligase family protein [Streptomyces sp. NPDC057686]|uniref:fatty acid CoA ligase family protein n=1 Tax=Streptomyces sp. NPDC057686 TaxID=3346212 RepID=UPI003697A345
MSETSLTGLITRQAIRNPSRPALIHPDRSRREPDGGSAYTFVDYARLAARITACAAGLSRRGIGRGTRTALLVPPGADLLTLVCAMLHIGAVPVTIDPGMGLSKALDCIRNVQVEAFIGVPAAHLLRRVRRGAFAEVRTVISIGRKDGSGLQELIDLGADHPVPALQTEPDQLALICYTTGSTGPAKPVEVTAGMLCAMARITEEAHYTPAMGTSLVTLPLMGLFDLAAGRTVVVPKMNMGKVGAADPVLLTDAIRRFSVNAMFASPALLEPLEKYLEQTKTKLPSLKLVISGGAPVKSALLAALRSHLPADAHIFNTYGSTEALPITLLESREVLTTAYGSAAGMGVCVGRPAPGTALRTIKISDAPIPQWNEGLTVPPGYMGEIVVSGDGVSSHYFQSPASDALHKIQDGTRNWHRTGDVGWVDTMGRVWFSGRKGHRVRAAGGDLHTVSCEGVFNVHPDVSRTALVGVGPDGGQRPVLCVELTPGSDPSQWSRIEDELRALGSAHPMTKKITDFLLHRGFPVDIRHNAKIRREVLATWAGKRLTRGRRLTRALRMVPLLGWAYLAAYPLQPWHSSGLTAFWWLVAVLSVAGHGAQIPSALRAERKRATGRRPTVTVTLTMLFGATWWRSSHAEGSSV